MRCWLCGCQEGELEGAWTRLKKAEAQSLALVEKSARLESELEAQATRVKRAEAHVQSTTTALHQRDKEMVSQ